MTVGLLGFDLDGLAPGTLSSAQYHGNGGHVRCYNPDGVRGVKAGLADQVLA